MCNVNASTAQVLFPSTTLATASGCGLESIAGRHTFRNELFNAPEQFLMLQFLVTEPHKRLERGLVSEPVIAADLEHLCVDVPLDEAEHIRIGATLYLAEIALLAVGQEGELLHFGKSVRQEFMSRVEGPVPNYVFVDRPSYPLRSCNSAGVTVGVDLFLLNSGLHGVTPSLLRSVRLSPDAPLIARSRANCCS